MIDQIKPLLPAEQVQVVDNMLALGYHFHCLYKDGVVEVANYNYSDLYLIHPDGNLEQF